MPFDPSSQHDDPFENRLSGALREAGGAYETDRNALVTAGAARGRRLRLRRRAAVVGGVAGIALVGIGGTLFLPGSGDDSGKQTVATGTTTPTPAATATSGNSENDENGEDGEDGGGSAGDELISALKKLLPQGEFTEATARGGAEEQAPYVAGVYDDGKGAGAVSVSLSRLVPGEKDQWTTCPDKAQIPYDGCEVSELSDGSSFMVFQGYEYPDRRVDTKRWTADLVTPQGHHVSVSEWNAAAEKDSPITRDQPPLSPDELKEVATDPSWRTVIDASPENSKDGQVPEAGGSVPQGPSGLVIKRTLVELLRPEGLKVVGSGGQDTEYAYLVLDDGKGRSLVQINVQPDMRDVEDQLFGADAEVLPDGTKVTTRKKPGEKGGAGVVMWTADTIRPGGLRVVISAFNSGAQNTAATRETPALTIEQLKAIATSEEWKKLQPESPASPESSGSPKP
ncbi:hypothetical protein [Streptomyces sp. 2A115]|uniref:hypothetical protein n=1 Tax=Streptomyces sp. 2A115 TaxID=3457439 RepID=UPI003FCF92CA